MLYGVLMKKKVYPLPDNRCVTQSGLDSLKVFNKAVRNGEIVSFALVGIKKDGKFYRAYNQERLLPLIGALDVIRLELASKFE